MPSAITDLGLAIVTACFAVCLALIAHALYPRRAQPLDFRAHGRVATSVNAAVEFLALWAWLTVGLPLVASMVWLGDNHHWFYDYAWFVSAAIAATIAAVAARRYRRGNVSRGYRRFHFLMPLGLLAIFCGVRTYDFVLGVDGRTAQGAAQNILSHFTLDEPVRLVEMTPDQAADVDMLCSKAYWIMGASEPRGRLIVKRYYHFWWSYAGSMSLRPSRQQLQLAKAVLDAPWERDRAIDLLRGVVSNYPNTAAAIEARQLLESLVQGIN